jgi:galactonate dehydratase
VEAARLPPLPHSRLNITESSQPIDNPPSRASLEPHQTDLEGHYVGPSSGVSFLVRAQRKLYKYLELPVNAPIFTFGDCPLPRGESAFMLLPPKKEANALVARYFDFAFPTHRFLHQQQVEGWVDEFYTAVLRSEAVSPSMRGKRAVVLMVFAQARQCQSDSDQTPANFSTTRFVSCTCVHFRVKIKCMAVFVIFLLLSSSFLFLLVYLIDLIVRSILRPRNSN